MHSTPEATASVSSRNMTATKTPDVTATETTVAAAEAATVASGETASVTTTPALSPERNREDKGKRRDGEQATHTASL